MNKNSATDCDLKTLLMPALERVWKAQGRAGTFAEFVEQHMNMSEEERVRQKVDDWNRTPGTPFGDYGFTCDKCLNRGDISYAYHDGRHWVQGFYMCECRKTWASLRKLKDSGLLDGLKKFSDFKVDGQKWRQDMLDAGQRYARADLSSGVSMFLGGAVGGGKTHICTAVCRELLHRGFEVVYMPWLNEARRLKAIGNTEEGVGEIARYCKAAVLYIDDLFKPTKDQPDPTGADIRLAYEIINYRLINKLPMIISCEKYMMELLEYDEALISRVYEVSKPYTVNIKRDPARNYRMQGADLLT